ncbi:MAG: DUF4386 domain-containing protein [Actinomycetota bacterium]|nr:DUF4386 domain-containing protein [Actinomycetota bacterium]
MAGVDAGSLTLGRTALLAGAAGLAAAVPMSAGAWMLYELQLGPAAAWLLVAAMLDLVVAGALYRLLAPVHRDAAALALGLRLVYAAVFVGLTVDLGTARYAAQQDLETWADWYLNGWQVLLVLYGVHLLLTGWLIWVSGYLPRWLGALVAVAGVGYLIDWFVVLIADAEAPLGTLVLFVGELVFMVWLLVWGRKLQVGPPSPEPQPA